MGNSSVDVQIKLTKFLKEMIHDNKKKKYTIK
jgi:hypothetical protein